MTDSRIDEVIKGSPISPAARADIRAVIDSSPYLQDVIRKGIDDNRIRQFTVSRDPNEGGHYDRGTGSISINADLFAIKRTTDRLDILTGVIGHEAGHALMARSAEITVHRYAYEVTSSLRDAAHNGDAGVDITSFAKRATEDFRRNEGLAELVSMNAVASRVAKTNGGFDMGEFLKRADVGTECVDKQVLEKGIHLNDQGIQVTGGKINSPAVERIAQCHFDNGANTLGLKGASSYDDHYAAYMVASAADIWNDHARSTTRPMPQIEVDLGALKSSPRSVEDAGVDLGGEGKRFDFIDVSGDQRRSVTVRQLGQDATKQPDTNVDLARKPLLADDPAHPDHATFNRVHEWVRGTGHWDESKSHNITAALYREVADSPLVKRVDSVMGGVGQNGSENVFAVYAPHGDKGPFFHAQVDGRVAGQQPAQQSLEQAEVIKQDRVQAQAMEQQQTQEQAKGMQPSR